LAQLEPMLELFVFETNQLIGELEEKLLVSEQEGFTNSINEIFRIMHTIKGSAAMMLFNNIADVAHSVEDVFFYFREEHPELTADENSKLIDLVLEAVDFIKMEIAKIEEGQESNGNAGTLNQSLSRFLEELQVKHPPQNQTKAPKKKESQKMSHNLTAQVSTKEEPVSASFQAQVLFSTDCDCIDLRAFAVLNNFKNRATIISYSPQELIDNDDSIAILKESGLNIIFDSALTIEQLEETLLNNAFVKEVRIGPIAASEVAVQSVTKEIILDDSEVKLNESEAKQQSSSNSTENALTAKQSMISVSVNKLDVLMDLVGELVIAEAMVTRNPELDGLVLDNFHKAAQQLRKITNELQDVVMSIRMVPLTQTFQKMNRIVRDMSRKLNKKVKLEIVGEETEVDKNIIEHISDPLMHLIRNSMDHGLESNEERKQKGKPEYGQITLEAKNAGGDVLILVKDDGRGLDREKILKKARANGLVAKDKDASEISDREVYSYILLPGFSTKEEVSEFSGRGVGMDVVAKSIEKIGGTVIIDSTPEVGTVITLKIPLTLAIIDGMTVRVGNSQYTVPTTSIRESFRMRPEDLIADPDGNEMILIRGKCYPIVRLHERFQVKTDIDQVDQGIVMMVESNDKGVCLFADELLGEQQVVVKALPNYIKKIKGIAGCTLLGNGSISLILDVANLCNELAS
jgi:two-component system chemotaxis sensor kinase CheA